MKGMKGMRAMKAMKKAMKKRKKKRVSKIAKGRYAKVVVFRGSKAKTTGGLTKDMLKKNASGKIVSKKRSAHGLRAYVWIKPWSTALSKARKALGVAGFVAVNG